MHAAASRWRLGWGLGIAALLVGTYAPRPQAITGGQSIPQDLGPQLERTEQTLYGVLGPLGQWNSVEIMLNNNSPSEMRVAPTLYGDGEGTDGEVIVLQPAETRWVNVRDLLPRRGWTAPIDAVELRYFGYLLDLRTQMVVRRSAQLGSVDVLFTGGGEFRSRTLNAVWVTPAAGRAIVTLGNTSGEDITASVSDGPRTRQIRIRAHDIVTLTRPGLLLRATADSLAVVSDGPVGALRAGGYIEFGARTFGIVRFFDPGVARLANLAASNLRTAGADVQMALYNTSSVPVWAHSEARPVARDGGMPILLPAIYVPPHQAVKVDTSLLRTAALDRASIRVVNSGTAGSLIGYLAAIDRTSLVSYELPLREGGTKRLSTGNYPWRLDGDYSSIVSIVNAGATPAVFTSVITYDGGVYRPAPQTVSPGGTATFDLRDSDEPGRRTGWWRTASERHEGAIQMEHRRTRQRCSTEWAYGDREQADWT